MSLVEMSDYREKVRTGSQLQYTESMGQFNESTCRV